MSKQLIPSQFDRQVAGLNIRVVISYWQTSHSIYPLRSKLSLYSTLTFQNILIVIKYPRNS